MMMTRRAALRLLIATTTMTMTLCAAVRIEKTAWSGWPNCYRITNGEVELIVTTDVGPRVMRYAFVGGQNLFKEFTAQLGKTGEKEWTPRGGHRIWMGPEDAKLTYALDNGPVKIDVKGSVVTLTQPVEPETGLEKQITIQLAETGTAVEVRHRLKNAGKQSRRLAPWALTMMAQGGHGITGFPPRGTHPKDLPPSNPLVMWPFTDLSDKRWTFTRKYLVLTQDPHNTGQPNKLGHFNPNTWGAYLLGTDLFIKRYTADPSKAYPDFQSSYETFTSADFLELETLGPLTTLEPGQSLEHAEHWTLHRNVKVNQWTDAELDRAVLPLLQQGR